MKKHKIHVEPLNLILPLILLLAWFLIPIIMHVPEYLLPSPKKVLIGMLDFMFGFYNLTPYAGEFLSHSASSMGRVLCGFTLALIFGLPLGILTGHFVRINRLFDPLIHLLRMVPGIGWLPIAMVWFGVGNATTIFLISLASFFPIYLNAAQGVKHVPEKIIQAGRMLGARRVTLFVKIIIPAAIPNILSGMRLGLGVCWAYLVLGELTGVSKGLGAVMMDARMFGNVDTIIICMISIALWGMITDKVLVAIINKIHPSWEDLPND